MNTQKRLLTLAAALGCAAALSMTMNVSADTTTDTAAETDIQDAVLISAETEDETADTDAPVTSAEYTTKTIDKSVTYQGKNATLTDTERYTRIVLQGDSDAVKKINRALRKACKEEVSQMPNSYDEDYLKNITYDTTYTNVHKSKVTYNDNGVISIRVSYEWYQGGVADYGCKCYTFDLNTGKQLHLTDVCSGTNKSLTKKIKNRLLKAYGADTFMEDQFEKINAKKCDFYLNKKGKAVVAFDKYEIAEGAAGAFDVTLKSLYQK